MFKNLENSEISSDTPNTSRARKKRIDTAKKTSQMRRKAGKINLII